MDKYTLEMARKHFSVLDYKHLNPDIHLAHPNLYINHFMTKGAQQGRLHSRKLLNIQTEFGRELILFIPYIYSLYQRNLLFPTAIISSFCGMRPFYYFLDEKQLNEKDDCRTSKMIQGLYFNHTDNLPLFNTKYWTPPPYKEVYYTPDAFQYEKPLCIIQNKYNLEWKENPVNYINTDCLHRLFTLLENSYQIVYIRPHSANDSQFGYSHDDNEEMELNDTEVLTQHPQVIPWNSLQEQHSQRGWNYNELKLRLFASCTNYISVLGGNNYLNLYFAKKLLILRRRKGDSGLYSGWYKQVAPDLNPELVVANNWDDLEHQARGLFIPSTCAEQQLESSAPNPTETPKP